MQEVTTCMWFLGYAAMAIAPTVSILVNNYFYLNLAYFFTSIIAVIIPYVYHKKLTSWQHINSEYRDHIMINPFDNPTEDEINWRVNLIIGAVTNR